MKIECDKEAEHLLAQLFDWSLKYAGWNAKPTIDQILMLLQESKNARIQQPDDPEPPV